MSISIALFICVLMLNILLRFVLRAGIKSKTWKKHAKGSFIRKWFLWDFYKTISHKVAFWIHIISTVASPFFFLLNLIAFLAHIEFLEYITLALLAASAFFSFDTLQVVWFLKSDKKDKPYLVIRVITLICIVAITTFGGVVMFCGALYYLINLI